MPATMYAINYRPNGARTQARTRATTCYTLKTNLSVRHPIIPPSLPRSLAAVYRRRIVVPRARCPGNNFARPKIVYGAYTITS